MKNITKILSLFLALTLLLSFPVAASAAELANVPTIDESRTGSLTIYKYDLTNGEKDGVWDSSYVTTGVYDEAGVNNVLGGSTSSTLGNGETSYGYAIKGVEFTCVKVADIFQYGESKTDNRTDAHVEVLYAVDKTNGADFLAALGLADGKNRYENADALDESKYFYQSDVLISALSSGLTANATTVKNAMERYAAANGTAMPLTDSYGKTKAENLPLGLYLVAETKVPEKSHIATLLIFLLIIPATLYFGLRLTGRAYYLTSTLVIIEIIIPFLLAFESRKPQARELVVIAVLSALAVAARVVIPIPNFKAIFAIIMLSGMAFGPEAGFLVGAVSAFASNFFFGQGAYTPWQMFAYGAGGMLAGFLFAKGRLPQKRWVMAIFGFLACVLFVGPLLDTCTVFLTLPIINAQTAWPLYVSGFPVNISQGICTALTMVLFGPALLEKLDRVKLQYGMEDDDGV